MEIGHAHFWDKYQKYGRYHWLWYDQKESYRRYVDTVSEWIEEKNTLDIGAGEGVIVSKAGIKGMDNNETAVRLAKEDGIPVEYGDVYDMKYRDGEFDSVFIGHTLEHLKDAPGVLQNIKRIFTKYLYIVVPRSEKPFFTSRRRLKEMVEKEGYETMEVFSNKKEVYGKFKKKG